MSANQLLGNANQKHKRTAEGSCSMRFFLVLKFESGTIALGLPPLVRFVRKVEISVFNLGFSYYWSKAQ